jgi:hypothetical protein
MEQVIKAFANQVANDGKKKLRAAMRTVVDRVEKDFMTQAEACLDNYYMEYKKPPSIYDRTGNLRKNGINPYRRYRRDEIDVGVSFDASNMEEYKRRDNFPEVKGKPYITKLEELVVYNAMEGIHGNESVYVGRNIDQAMMHFTIAYAHWFLDGYFKEILNEI